MVRREAVDGAIKSRSCSGGTKAWGIEWDGELYMAPSWAGAWESEGDRHCSQVRTLLVMDGVISK